MNKVIFNTAGDGFWSSVINARVEITDVQVAYIDDDFQGLDPEFGELRVYFNTDTWDVDQHGLIYTDSLFMKQLRNFLDSHGLAGKDVDYSEQGMQGDDYVSFDVGAKFLESWGNKFDTDWDAMAESQQAAFQARWGN
jgi:hypothetical protein